MNRSRAAGALLALLAVLSFAGAAATLDATSGSGPGVGDGSGAPVSEPVGGDGPNSDLPLDAVLRVLSVLLSVAMLVALVAGVYAFYEEYGARGLAGMAVAAVLVALVVALLFGALQLDLRPPGGPNQSQRAGTTTPGEAGLDGGAADATAPATPPVVLALGLAVALLVGGLVLVRATGGAEYAPESPEPAGGDEAAALGRVAGRAADRIDRGAVVDNEVYRAWREMTGHLDVDHPDAATPAEFAGAAVDAGLDRADVDELTRLFEEVRYGGGEATEARERRAVAALRRIEEGYR